MRAFALLANLSIVGQAIVFCRLPGRKLRMNYYRRRLPHWHPENADYFITWRLAGSPPPVVPEILTAANTGRLGFRAYDEALDRTRTGPQWLADTRIAAIVRNALLYGEQSGLYQLEAWVIMPNHVHLVIEPRESLANIMRRLKATTARRANRVLGRAGERFWQEESYDHWIRSARELEATIAYVERNPTTAGFVLADADWPWSSASRCAGDENRSPALRTGE